MMQQGIDSAAMLVTLITKLPVLLALAVAGAILGSGLHLIITFIQTREPVYVSETEYYIDFAEGRYEAKDYYNDFTWNDVLSRVFQICWHIECSTFTASSFRI